MHFSDLLLEQKRKKKETDIEIIRFDDEEIKPRKGSKNKAGKFGTILKTSPITFVFGHQSLELEREISDLISLQLGIGANFKPVWAGFEGELLDAIYENGSFCQSENWYSDVCDSYYDSEFRNWKGGIRLTGMVRLFFDNEGFEGSYIAPVIRYSTRNYQVQRVQEGVNFLERLSDSWEKESTRDLDIVVHYGYQTLYEKLTVDWFSGLGARLRHSRRLDVGADISGNYGNAIREFDQSLLRFELGVRIGFQL